MNIRQSRLFKLLFGSVLALVALLGAGSAMAYSGNWSSVAIEGQSFSVKAGDFIRFGVTDIPDCADSGCQGRWSFKGFTSDGTAYCTNQYWGGDPYPGRAKNCEKLTQLTVYGTPSYPVSYKYVATEGSSTLLYTTVTNNNANCSMNVVTPCSEVWYMGWSSNSVVQFTVKAINNSMTCNNASFGTDPSPGVLKYCFFPK
ncbi:hypothetical protein JNX00_06250 [Hydrogenophaga sp. YM1]|uniref:hypothetical protein n=1 Tax=Hydrogenophaga sp. YM1 TaxID=2806262 RepID=UPI0019570BE7|nr:hypothetical protein [Hydrogenophaga sp. YM1]QRR35464.1 hypothetical protein JNX00_06250 [Hydrogenophaga sp. YM1]